MSINLHNILDEYVKGFGTIIRCLNVTLPNNSTISFVRNAYNLAKNNETVFIEATGVYLFKYSEEILNSKLDTVKNVHCVIKKEDIDDINSLNSEFLSLTASALAIMNSDEKKFISELLKKLLKNYAIYINETKLKKSK